MVGQPGLLLALTGDSYVEALMVPFWSSMTGRLTTRSTPGMRVYSFGTSSSALSNYLAYADFAAQRFRPQAMVFLNIGNDFDESLLRYKNDPGHSYFVKNPQGGLTLQRIDYEPSLWRLMIRKSALVRDVTLNTDLLNFLLTWQPPPFGRPSNEQIFVGNTGAKADPIRIADAQRAIDTFLAHAVGQPTFRQIAFCSRSTACARTSMTPGPGSLPEAPTSMSYDAMLWNRPACVDSRS